MTDRFEDIILEIIALFGLIVGPITIWFTRRRKEGSEIILLNAETVNTWSETTKNWSEERRQLQEEIDTEREKRIQLEELVKKLEKSLDDERKKRQAVQNRLDIAEEKLSALCNGDVDE